MQYGTQRAMAVFAGLAVCLLLLSAGPLSAQGGDPFASVAACAQCHSDLQVPAGAADIAGVWTPPRLRDQARPDPPQIGPEALWKSTMMAHASVDPYWRAKVRFESAITPAASSVIEDKCLSCHAPMQQYNFRQAGRQMRLDQLGGTGRGGSGLHGLPPDHA